MQFPQAVGSGLRNYVNFNGRAARSEYWYWTLFEVLVSIVTEFSTSRSLAIPTSAL
jgi:uncharacterized membrane protein YhaH (DUF805 family)